MLPELDTYDWEEAFKYAVVDKVIGSDVSREAFTRDDVSEIAAIAEGENDGDSWVVCGLLADGRWFVLRAWCDYTGWGCQEGGDSEVANSRDEIIRFGLTQEERRRLSLGIEDDQC